METLTRFNNIRYEHFKVNFKGLIIEVKLLDNDATFPNSNNKDFCEEFKISITNKEKTINFKFYNSIMEREISQLLNTNGLENVYKNLLFGDYGIFKAGEFKKLMTKKFMWGGVLVR